MSSYQQKQSQHQEEGIHTEGQGRYGHSNMGKVHPLTQDGNHNTQNLSPQEGTTGSSTIQMEPLADYPIGETDTVRREKLRRAKSSGPTSCSDGSLAINMTGGRPLSMDEQSLPRRRLRRVNAGLDFHAIAKQVLNDEQLAKFKAEFGEDQDRQDGRDRDQKDIDLNYIAFGNLGKRTTLNQNKMKTLDVKKTKSMSIQRHFAKEEFDRSQLVQDGPTKLTGIKKWKHRRRVQFAKTKSRISEVTSDLEIWRSSFKVIEGNFGSSVGAYFRFLKWLFFLNLFIAILILGVIILPQVLMKPSTFAESIDDDFKDWKYTKAANVCTTTYEQEVNEGIGSLAFKVLDFFQGTGWMETTVLFYGFYFNRTYNLIGSDRDQHYNMPVAYILVTLVYFLVSLIVMVRYTASGMKERLALHSDQYYHSCGGVFCGWDFSLSTEKAALIKKKNLYQEYTNDLAEQRREMKRQSRTTCKICGLFTIRVIINLIVIGILAVSGYVIYLASTESSVWLEDPNLNSVLRLAVEFLPSIVITGLNIVVPVIFQKVVLLEDYSPLTEIRVTLLRTVFLRLASVAFLLITIFPRFICNDDDRDDCGKCKTNSTVSTGCWETYTGQQIYKLVILDFFVVIGVILFVEFPRRVLISKFPENKLLKIVGFAEFEIPKNVLDLVYSQTLCWIGAFFCPLIPAITVIKFFIYFYFKKLSLLRNNIPSSKAYKASRSNSFFMTILMVSFVLCAIPVCITVGWIAPSKSCGPFRVYSKADYFMFNSVTDGILMFPDILRQIFAIVASWFFIVPLVVVLILTIYYYSAVTAGHKRMAELLKEQLALEGKDKQFLLQQVNAALNRIKG